MQVAKTGVSAILGLIGWLILSFGAASAGAFFSPGEWYAQLNKPGWTPPGWLFGPVWTALYIMMAVAAWRVWRRAGFSAHPVALGLFLGQLFFNGIWSWLFFGLHAPGLGFGDIVILWLTLAATLAAFFKIDLIAGWLLIPYLAWVTFASALNFAIWRMN